MNLPSHGANPHYLYEKLGLAMPKNIIDFSANINPLGPPGILKENWDSFYEQMQVYPDPEGRILKRKIAENEKISEQVVLLGNGAAELLALVGRMLAGKKVLLIQPTFSEYEKVCRANGCEVHYYIMNDLDWQLDLEKIKEIIHQVDAVFLCNPNNPTGIYYQKGALLVLLKECVQHDCYFILDEAFYDFVPAYENMIPEQKNYPSLIIVRSMTKMFSIPGIRLGYMVANPSVIKKMAEFQPHWSLNSIALKTGELLLEEKAFVAETIQYVEKEKQVLAPFYAKMGLNITNSQANFYLLKDPLYDKQHAFLQFLLKEGIVARHTYNYPGLDGRWLRFAIKNRQENERLQGVMTKWMKTQR
ncbi:threonine-phosphate decarboxylase CobD [Niallia sp. NCCP-28]|uniref:threonine-phosphate decarboxylase CobD n=1 Tax=Niallia sp. NCCP-28 TaxID=2934712 RepID=UPI0020800863|nr:threonine-phosphate decarboxylase CobD [Niallia sp. NCCP-28]GKU84662.1 threonine-phosphate decarboxylase [Niallia sp. NCCP-28]